MVTDELLDFFDTPSIVEKHGSLDIGDIIPLHQVIRTSITECTRLLSRMMMVDPKTPEQWLAVKAITAPSFDDVFVMKSHDLKSFASAKVGKKLIEEISASVLPGGSKPPEKKKDTADDFLQNLLSTLRAPK